jgi:AcrR family transcriptional regulator
MRTVDPQRYATKRRQVLDAAAEVFAAHGLDAATTAQICRAAGMSPGNVFHYFASKREIFLAVIADGEEGKATRLAAATQSPDPVAGLVEVVRLLIEPAGHPLGPPLVMEAMLQARRDPDLQAWLERDRQAELAALSDLLTRAHRAGRIDPELPVAAAATWLNMLVGAFYLQAATDPAFDPVEQTHTLDLVINRFLRLI